MKYFGGMSQSLKGFGLTVFMHLLFSLNVWFLRLTGMNVQNEFQRCICMSPWELKAAHKQQSCCWDDCVLYPVWAWKQCHVNYLNSHTATVVVTTGTNFFAADPVRVRISPDCEMILNYSG